MNKVLVGVGCVDDQQEAVILEAVEVSVVNGAAVLVGNDAVLGLVEVEGHHVAGEHVLQEFHALRSGDQDSAHVGDVEKAAEVTGVKVLGHDTGRVLDGHVPTAEVYHLAASGNVDVVKLGAFEFAHVITSCVLKWFCIRMKTPEYQKAAAQKLPPRGVFVPPF